MSAESVNNLRERLFHPWMTITEIDPPASACKEDLVRIMERIPDRWVVITDNPDAGPAMAPMAMCCHLLQLGLAPIMGINLRDHNRIAVQSMILGAVSLGIQAFLVQPGEHPNQTSMAASRTVYDIDPVQAVKMIREMRDQARLTDGTEIRELPAFLIGMMESPLTGDTDLKPFFLEKRIQTGVDFLITLPITDFKKLQTWRKSINHIPGIERIPIFIGLKPGVRTVPNGIKGSGCYRGVVVKLDQETDENNVGMPGGDTRRISPGKSDTSLR